MDENGGEVQQPKAHGRLRTLDAQQLHGLNVEFEAKNVLFRHAEKTANASQLRDMHLSCSNATAEKREGAEGTTGHEKAGWRSTSCTDNNS